ncbi:hypothetical protein [Lacrimispora celerecrescens]|uniref:Uncharacterized protein n=1 Tax=[Clostridium] celerecrescens 18A TaxID=1286362 RepID=A0A2M8Z312_9FIRM|nr:hypothetical protein [Lacrimispora celerecrescens]PJJ27821.1 hypothetical protein H171_1301 [[Clostridium] celerecrescens 18A]
MMDTISKDLYSKVMKAQYQMIEAFLDYVNYEDEIADGLTGMSYILFCENIPFSFDGQCIAVPDFGLKISSGEKEKLYVEFENVKKSECYPAEVYNKYLEKRK